MCKMTFEVTRRLRSEGGQALTEYAMVLAFVALACMIALGVLAVAIGIPFDAVADVLNGIGS